MKKNDLRVGNKVITYDADWKQIEATVITVGQMGICVEEHNSLMTYDHVKGIPLTEEWFLKFGFFKENCSPASKNHGSYYSLHVYDYKYSFAYASFRDDWGFYHSYTDANSEEENNRFDFISCGIKYVHQLQNLIFLLTGEELELKVQ